MSVDWPVQTLGDVCEKITDGAHNSPKSVGRGKPMASVKDLTRFGVNLNGARLISEEDFEKLVKQGCRPEVGDVLIAKDGNSALDTVCTVDEPLNAVLLSSVAILRPNKDKLDSDYLKYYFCSKQVIEYLKKNFISGAAIPRVVLKDFRKAEIKVPPLYIQKEISKRLRSLDDKIKVNTQINQTLESIAQLIFKSWFVDFEPVKAKIAALEAGGSYDEAERAAMRVISGKDELALTELQQQQPEIFAELAKTTALFPSAMQESELGDIPIGWEVSTIGSSYKVVMGQSPKGDTYNENKNGVVFYQGRAEFGWRFPTPRLYTTDPKKMAEKGDVLMSVRAPVGDLNIALENCCIGRGLSALRHESGSTTFSFYQLKDLQHQLDRFNGEGTVFGSINQNDLKSLQVVSPYQPIIDKYISKLSRIDQQIENFQFEILSLEAIKDTLLPKLFSGEIELNIRPRS
ncbi:restriction endonuclease subunit S [Bacillus sp. ISL-18]|uniref:restriction endonuclease subunit S n=1 Tax=Bacillus sp. ISL-18 TaxID=2819118 RepID=UPI001BECAFBB|nr:restriction endonuclease subunit S [Bacillus sp. ISL-18]MBT2655364.1 restriction endonuclease subunit S [Bacillus sp. ISL-18]